MSTMLVCPDCAKVLRVPNKKVGCQIQCPQCGALLVVPDPITEPSQSLNPNAFVRAGRTVPSRERPLKQQTAPVPPAPQLLDVWSRWWRTIGVDGYGLRFWVGLGVAIFALILVTNAATLWVASRVFRPQQDQQAKHEGTESARLSASDPIEPAERNTTTANRAASESAPPIIEAVVDTQPESNTASGPSPLNIAVDDWDDPATRVEERDGATASTTESVVADGDVPTAQDSLRTHSIQADALGCWGDHYGLQGGVMKRIGDVDVVLGYKFATAYVPGNASDIAGSNVQMLGIAFPVGYRQPGRDFEDPTAGYIPIVGKPQKVEYSCNDPSVVMVHNDGSAGFRRAGEVVVTAQVAGESISLPFTVVQFPLNSGRVSRQFEGNAADAEEVIRLLGLPDQKVQHFVGTDEARTIDGIYYSGGIRVEHWTYKKYPGAVFAIAGHPASGWLWCISTYQGRRFLE